MSRPGERHCLVTANSARILGNYTFQRKKGYVLSNDPGLIIERDPDTVRGPDVALYDELRQYRELSVKYPDRAPKLIVEVQSPNDRAAEVIRRIYRFLAMGVALVWLLDAEDRMLTVFRSGKEPVFLKADQEVTGEDVLPDLRIKVADFFALPGE